jgi:DNA polymerase-1
VVKATTADAYSLFHDGALALARVEAAGMRIDVKRLDAMIERAGIRIKELAEELKESAEWEVWKKRFRSKASLGSRTQLGVVLFEELGCKVGTRTASGRAQVNEEQLEKLDVPFVHKYLQAEKMKKLQGTYLKGIWREVVDGFIHPSFNLHLARTYRSSSDSPNFQNIPIRDPKIGKVIRSCFIPRDGHVLVEIDYGALEFRVCACFWRDKAMVAYASDPALDVHRDMASECYAIPIEEVSKQARFFAKNNFVFPTLYGSYYKNTSQHLWAVMDTHQLVTNSGQPLEECLKANSITKRNYEEHIQGVERKFQGRFPEWTQRKEVWWKKYLKSGEFRLMTGFLVEGAYSRNNLMNYPIQGPAFHILLWSLIQLVKWTAGKRTKIVGQIHDSIVADVHRDELDEYLAAAKQVMTVDVRKHWDWIVTPLEIEAEVAEDNWFNKKVVAV